MDFVGSLGSHLEIGLAALLCGFLCAFAVLRLRGTATPVANRKTETEAEQPHSRPSIIPEASNHREPVMMIDAKLESAPNILPRIDYEEDEDVDPTILGMDYREERKPKPTARVAVLPIVFDREAADDEPTHAGALIVTSGSAQTDKGVRRKRNEDSLLVAEQHALYVVADGMGGYAGGEIASSTAVETIGRAFQAGRFDGGPHTNLPKQASDLACAIQMANSAILAEAKQNRSLEGMGTTVVAARFSPNKQRLYIGHVGDSRVYRLRNDRLSQITADHTMKDLGVEGAEAAHLSRAVGIWPVVPVDVVLVKPMPNDVYLLCSDGLTKMVSHEAITEILRNRVGDPNSLADLLVAKANANGGKDNVTVIVVRVDAPKTGQRAA